MGTRDALVRAAAELMDSGGLEAVTLRDVGRRAGVSHNAPYKHFAGKEALLAAVAARELTSRGAALHEILAHGSAAGATLRAALRSYVDWALARPVRFKLIYGAWSTGTPELEAAATSTRALLTRIVAGAQDEGALPEGEPERLTALLLALAHGAVDLSLAGHLSPPGTRPLTAADMVNDLLERLKSAGPTPG
ncbi:TetR/AcrR family transcriptional regulator [Streptomyces sp. NPDC014733]|uniref:TetR/AcrR family transcriptional regulator n=1 Tax=Streptomyces sp. NPDC014733 TaxID=3364885 RepID=UPI0036F4F648